MSMKFHHTVLAVVSLGFFLTGCGGAAPYEGPKRYPVTGSIKFQGEPVDGGMLSLIPEDGSSNPAGGPITNGTFEIETNKGPNAAAYRVSVHWYKPTGKMIKDPDTGEEIPEVKQVIPAKYNDGTQLTHTFTGDPESDKLDLNLD